MYVDPRYLLGIAIFIFAIDIETILKLASI
jgi:hypothetical protein